jgi:hypothetical protein
MVVAHHQAIAEWRRVSRLGLGGPTEVPDPQDPADRVEAQFALAAMLDAFKRLSDAEREAIRAGLVRDERTDAPEPASLKMRRHRARRHLDLLVDGWR